jgi:hypothetical protein
MKGTKNLLFSAPAFAAADYLKPVQLTELEFWYKDVLDTQNHLSFFGVGGELF